MSTPTTTPTETFEITIGGFDHEAGRYVTTTEMVTLTTIRGEHCQQCGATDLESLNGDQGYTACCNERVVTPDYFTGRCDRTDCHHTTPAN